MVTESLVERARLTEDRIYTIWSQRPTDQDAMETIAKEQLEQALWAVVTRLKERELQHREDSRNPTNRFGNVVSGEWREAAHSVALAFMRFRTELEDALEAAGMERPTQTRE